MSENGNKCPVTGGGYVRARTNRDWWPEQPDLRILHQNSDLPNPMDKDFDYARGVPEPRPGGGETGSARADDRVPGLVAGRLRPLRPADHPHGVARRRHLPHRRRSRRRWLWVSSVSPPLNSWPDNANLDKARRLLWPIKKKYGRKISWADLMILAGNWRWSQWDSRPSASRAGARMSGSRKRTSTGGLRTSGWTTTPLRRPRTREPAGCGADGSDLRESGRPQRQPGSARRGQDIRETFGRMAMNDEETVALIAGGHTFGKTHGAGPGQPTSGRSRRRSHRGAGPGLEEHLPQRQRPRHHHQRPGGHLDVHAHAVEQRVPAQPVRL
jgi:catalase-peroxidase